MIGIVTAQRIVRTEVVFDPSVQLVLTKRSDEYLWDWTATDELGGMVTGTVDGAGNVTVDSTANLTV